MLRNYIGLASTPHDPALAIIDSEGKVVFAEANERYLQVKRAWNSTPDDINRIGSLLNNYCEKGAELVIATTWSKRTFNRLRLIRPLFERLYKRRLPSWAYLAFCNVISGVIANGEHVGNNLMLRYFEISPASRVIKRFYDHHLTHAVAACYSSPFKEAVCAVVDGYGEGSSTAFFRYQDDKLTLLPSIKPSKRASLGLFYAGLCWACGFDPVKGEEWKVMGLAPYGKYDQNIYQLLRPMIKVKHCRLVYGSDAKTRYFKLFEMRRNRNASTLQSADLAYTGQLVFCEVFEELLNNLHQLKLSDNLVLTGGCALNSSWNGKILEKTPFKNLYVFCAPADDGNAVGAALLAYYEDNFQKPLLPCLQTPYLGERISSETLTNLQRFSNLRGEQLRGEELYKRVAELIAAGKIVGWIQGRAEFGPRALGNRSILADPRTADIKDRLNTKVKFREEFRPYAPSILYEYGHEYFENFQESVYMERSLRFRREVIDKVPGVVHIDGTGRLQTVKREGNKKFYDLIAAFKEITDIPLILNTSFNIMGKPIIHSIEDAIAAFFTTGLDALVIEDQLYQK